MIDANRRWKGRMGGRFSLLVAVGASALVLVSAVAIDAAQPSAPERAATIRERFASMPDTDDPWAWQERAAKWESEMQSIDPSSDEIPREVVADSDLPNVLPEGVYDWGDQSPRGYDLNSYWTGSTTWDRGPKIGAGAELSDPPAGGVFVLGSTGFAHFFPTPEDTTSVSIVSYSAGVLVVAEPGGAEFEFDVNERRFL